MQPETPEIRLRPARADDSESVWRWRNDPDTRRASRDTDEVSRSDHERWYAAALSDPKRSNLMAEVGGKACGVVRFDLEEHALAEISINLSPEFRGRGLGQRILAKACGYGFEQLELSRIEAT